MDFKLWLQSPWCKAALVAVVGSIAAVNGIAWMQARAMTHYVSGGQRTAPPEQLSWTAKAWTVLTGVRLPRPTSDRNPQTVGLSYETHRIPLAKGEQLEAWFVPASTASRGIILLFPPYGGSKQALLAPSKIFHELGYDTLAVDFRGVGGSSGNDTTMGVREAQDVAQAVGYVQRQWQGRPIVLYGASMGSVAVMRAVAQEGVVPTAIILESPFDRLLSTVRHRFEAMGVPAFPGAELIVAWGGWQQGIDGFGHNPVEDAQKIRCPVLLMYGEYDQRVTLGEVRSIFAALPGRKQLAVFPAVDHGSLAGDDPLKWQQQVQQFLPP
jgi:uncharacterized protein